MLLFLFALKKGRKLLWHSSKSFTNPLMSRLRTLEPLTKVRPKLPETIEQST